MHKTNTMDPDTTLRIILNLDSSPIERERIMDACHDLRGWLSNLGFAPSMPSTIPQDRTWRITAFDELDHDTLWDYTIYFERSWIFEARRENYVVYSCTLPTAE